MHNISCARHRFPPEIIQYALWLYFWFPLSYRDVEDLLSERFDIPKNITPVPWCRHEPVAGRYRCRLSKPGQTKFLRLQFGNVTAPFEERQGEI